jgi:hypothetical protein
VALHFLLWSNFPLGNFNNDYDPGFSLNIGAERSIRSDLSMVGLIGFHQFYSPTKNQHLVQASLNTKFVFARFTERFAYVMPDRDIHDQDMAVLRGELILELV